MEDMVMEAIGRFVVDTAAAFGGMLCEMDEEKFDRMFPEDGRQFLLEATDLLLNEPQEMIAFIDLAKSRSKDKTFVERCEMLKDNVVRICLIKEEFDG